MFNGMIVVMIKVYMCLECGKEFKRFLSFFMYKFIYFDYKLYFCSYCGKNFFCKFDMKKYILMYMGVKFFQCK